MNAEDKSVYLYNKFGDLALEVAKEIKDSGPSSMIEVSTMMGKAMVRNSNVRYWNKVIRNLKKM